MSVLVLVLFLILQVLCQIHAGACFYTIFIPPTPQPTYILSITGTKPLFNMDLLTTTTTYLKDTQHNG